MRAKFKDQDDWERYSLELLLSPDADIFAKALHAHGWMIVVQPQYDDGPTPKRWFINKPCDDCPRWADNGSPPELPGTTYGLRERPQPTLQLIDGGKKDDES